MSGQVKNSVVSKCVIGEIDVTDSVLVNVTCKKLTGKGLILYNVCEPECELILQDGEVITHIFMDGEKEKLALACTTETKTLRFETNTLKVRLHLGNVLTYETSFYRVTTKV